MQTAIAHALSTISSTHNVRILLAVESGSRAWGFPSTDSDYDVRFIYHHPAEWYLSLYEGPDVIEESLNDGMLDIGGWELRKTLRLIAKGNVAPYEWLQSPIVYAGSSTFIKSTWPIISSSYSLKAGLHHYSSLARNVLEDLKGETIKVKRCFYGLRAALAARWILERGTTPPMTFDDLRAPLQGEIAPWASRLIDEKKGRDESFAISPPDLLTSFLEETLKLSEGQFHQLPHPKVDDAVLGDLFRALITTPEV